MLIAIAGRMASLSMHTPTTTTRENSGAPEITSSIIPGTPTHSKITGALGVALPSRSAVRHTWRQSTSGSLAQLLDRAHGQLERLGRRGQVAWPGAAV